MTACLAYSTGDPAGSGIAEALLSMLSSRPLRVAGAAAAYELPELRAVLAAFEADVLYFEFLDETCEADFYLVLSRHSSEARVRSLTVHHPGNPLREARAGGRPLELPPSNPVLAKRLLVGLARRAGRLEGFSVTYEATHHGPSSLRRPVTFVEIGSSAEEWRLEAAHAVVAEAVVEALTDSGGGYEVAVGVGGNHYAPLFTRRALEGDEAYGHIIANYALKSLDDPRLVAAVVREACLKSMAPTQKIVAEDKLRRSWREALAEVARELKLQLELA